MKKLILITTLLFLNNAFAWQAKVECKSSDSGNLVIDRADTENSWGGYDYQFVISGKALEHLKTFELVSEYEINIKNEFIKNLSLYDGNYRFFRGVREGYQIDFWFIKENNNIHLIVNSDDRIGTSSGKITDFYFNNCTFK
jgi:hypothetical protein